MLIYVTRGSVRPHLSSLSERLIAGLAYTDTRSYDTVSTRRFEPPPLNTTKGLERRRIGPQQGLLGSVEVVCPVALLLINVTTTKQPRRLDSHIYDLSSNKRTNSLILVMVYRGVVIGVNY